MIGVIGGSGFYSFFTQPEKTISVQTPYGSPSGPISISHLGNHEVAFLARHGHNHHYSAHTIPYQANMWALRMLGVERIFAPCAVGSLTTSLRPGMIVIPDQLVDRTWGRADTFFPYGGIHINFADPYCPLLRQRILEFPQVYDAGTMVVIQGPRFSTRAESQWFAQCGFRIINMTGYPEAALARELEICYIPVGLVTDYDAGIQPGDGVNTREVFDQLTKHHNKLVELLIEVIANLDHHRHCSHCMAHQGITLPFPFPEPSSQQ